jgi:hypothetical protein
MEFKIKYSDSLVLKISMAIIFGGLGLLNFISPVSKGGFLYHKWLIDALIAFLWLIQIYRPVYSSLFNKSILKVNEIYIYDSVADITYFWADIDEIYEQNSVLYITLHQPKHYLDKIGDPIRRWITKLRYKPVSKSHLFFISIDVVDFDPNDLLEVLNKYHITSMANKNP